MLSPNVSLSTVNQSPVFLTFRAAVRGIVVGNGKGFSRSIAKRAAARAALEYIREHGPSEPFKSDKSNAVLDLEKYLLNHRGGSLVPWLSWSVSHTGPDHRRTYHASARCEYPFQSRRCILIWVAVVDGEDVGYGEGYSIDGAKRMAATEALQWFYDNPQPPPPQPQKGKPKKVPDHAIDWDYIFEMAESGMM